jgi:ankyrin repeat protein
MFNLLLAAVITFQPVQQPATQPPKSPAPIQISKTEADEHSIEHDLLYLGVADSYFPSYTGITITVVVDTSGSIVSAVALPGNQEKDARRGLLIQAESMVRGLHFEPFLRAGHPVSVTFDRYVAVLPRELKPAQHVPFPKVKDWKSVKITLNRTGCFGTCPSYKVEVHGDGSVLYEGHGDVTFTGSHHGLVPQANVIELVKLFEQADYFSLADDYTASVTDNPTQTTSIEMDGRRKELVDYVGLAAGMPLSARKLEEAVDRLSGSARWAYGNAETVAALEAEHWDFKSTEAAATLGRAVERGTPDVVRDLVRAGVPLADNSLALESAASSGDLTKLRVLLEAGAGASARSLAAALVHAAGSGNVEAFRLLLQQGAGITSRDAAGRTVLIAGAASGFPEMVKEVLKNHADVNSSIILPPPTCTAEMKQNDDCPELAKDDGQTALMEAASKSDWETPPEGIDRVQVVRLLLTAGADVNARDKNGNTALILCDSNTEKISLLLQADADPNARNHEDETALSTATDDEVKKLLIQHGALSASKSGPKD